MKKIIVFILINILVVAVLRVTAYSSEKVPAGIFSVNGATVGVTTMNEVQKIYGKAKPVRVSHEDEADETICYVHSSPGGEAFLIFETGSMGGYEFITGFRLSSVRPRGSCIPTKVDIGSLATQNGIRLGQSLQEFRKAVLVKFKYRRNRLTYEGLSRRTATQEELKRLRAKWPNEKQDYFDVVTNIEAGFRHNKLADFYVRKIESY